MSSEDRKSPPEAIGGRNHDEAVKSPLEEARALLQLTAVHVLVVEDEDDARELLRMVLESAGCVVTTAANAQEAMTAMENSEALPDVLVSDIGLPGEDGYSLMRRIRALPPERGGLIPAAAITAYARGEDRAKALSAGYAVHVAKPIDPGELVMLVATLLTLPRSPQQRTA